MPDGAAASRLSSQPQHPSLARHDRNAYAARRPARTERRLRTRQIDDLVISGGKTADATLSSRRDGPASREASGRTRDRETNRTLAVAVPHQEIAHGAAPELHGAQLAWSRRRFPGTQECTVRRQQGDGVVDRPKTIDAHEAIGGELPFRDSRVGMESMQRGCPNCQRPFESSKAAEYCSGRGRAEASRKRKAQGRSERDRKVRGLLEEALEVLGVGEESV